MKLREQYVWEIIFLIQLYTFVIQCTVKTLKIYMPVSVRVWVGRGFGYKWEKINTRLDKFA